MAGSVSTASPSTASAAARAAAKAQSMRLAVVEAERAALKAQRSKSRAAFDDKGRFSTELASILSTFGEVKEPFPETLELIEQSVRENLLAMLVAGSAVQRHRHGKVSVDDLVFLIRKDPGKLGRLKGFLRWKEVLKKVRKGDESANAPLDEDENGLGTPLPPTANTPAVIPTRIEPQTTTTSKTLKADYDPVRALAQLPECGKDEAVELPIEPSLTTLTMEAAVKDRLGRADAITEAMSPEEYLEYSKRRQTSFVHGKGKRFREWLRYPGTLDDDTIQVLGYLAWDCVRAITEEALDIKAQMEGRPSRSRDPSETRKRGLSKAGSSTTGKEGRGGNGVKAEEDGGESEEDTPQRTTRSTRSTRSSKRGRSNDASPVNNTSKKARTSSPAVKKEAVVVIKEEGKTDVKKETEESSSNAKNSTSNGDSGDEEQTPLLPMHVRESVRRLRLLAHSGLPENGRIHTLWY